MACMAVRGFSAADLDRVTLGMAINYAHAYDDLTRRANGEEIPDDDARYQQLKRLEPLIEKRYAAGEISEDEYQSYKESLARWEA